MLSPPQLYTKHLDLGSFKIFIPSLEIKMVALPQIKFDLKYDDYRLKSNELAFPRRRSIILLNYMDFILWNNAKNTVISHMLHVICQNQMMYVVQEDENSSHV